jgi:hypothetical protein
VATAWSFFREVVQRLPPGDERVPIATQRAAALEGRLPKLVIRLAAGAPAGTKITRGGVEVGKASLGLSLPIDPGTHTIEVTAPGRRPAGFKVVAREGEQREIEVAAGVELGAAGAAGTEPPAGGSSRRTLGLVAGGVGIVGLVVGGAAGAATLGKKAAADDNCPDKRCNQIGFDAAESGRTLGTVSVVGFVVGALGIGTGAYFLLTDDTRGQARSAFVPSVGPSGFKLGWVKTW